MRSLPFPCLISPLCFTSFIYHLTPPPALFLTLPTPYLLLCITHLRYLLPYSPLTSSASYCIYLLHRPAFLSIYHCLPSMPLTTFTSYLTHHFPPPPAYLTSAPMPLTSYTRFLRLSLHHCLPPIPVTSADTISPHHYLPPPPPISYTPHLCGHHFPSLLPPSTTACLLYLSPARPPFPSHHYLPPPPPASSTCHLGGHQSQ